MDQMSSLSFICNRVLGDVAKKGGQIKEGKNNTEKKSHAPSLPHWLTEDDGTMLAEVVAIKEVLSVDCKPAIVCTGYYVHRPFCEPAIGGGLKKVDAASFANKIFDLGSCDLLICTAPHTSSAGGYNKLVATTTAWCFFIIICLLHAIISSQLDIRASPSPFPNS